MTDDENPKIAGTDIDGTLVITTNPDGSIYAKLDIMDKDEEAMFLNLLWEHFPDLAERTLPERDNLSFEEQYQEGYIVMDDVPGIVIGWNQIKLAEQYRSNEPFKPFVSIIKVSQ